MNKKWKKGLYNLLCKDMTEKRASEICEVMAELELFINSHYGMGIDFDNIVSSREIERLYNILENDDEYRKEFRGKRHYVRCGLLRFTNSDTLEKNTNNEKWEYISQEKKYEKRYNEGRIANYKLTERIEILQSEDYISFSTLLRRHIDDGLEKEQLLKYLIEDKKYIADIHTITSYGRSNDIKYRYTEDRNGRWPVYGKKVQDEVALFVSNLCVGTKRSEIIRAEKPEYIIEKSKVHKKKKKQKIENSEMYKKVSLVEAGLSTRLVSSAKKSGIEDIYYLLEKYNSGLLARCPGFGEKALFEIKNIDMNRINEMVLKKQEIVSSDSFTDEKELYEHISSRIYEILKKYPDVGLFVEQIQEIGLIEGYETNIIVNILKNAKWCKKMKNRYYLVEDSSIEEYVYGEEDLILLEEYTTQYDVDEKAMQLLVDPEEFIKYRKRKMGEK